MEENFIRALQYAYAMHCWHVLQDVIQAMWDHMSMVVRDAVAVLRTLGLIEEE
jgi:hypothetical protein